MKAEGTFEYQAPLFILALMPRFDLFDRGRRPRRYPALTRVFTMGDCDQLHARVLCVLSAWSTRRTCRSTFLGEILQQGLADQAPPAGG